MLANESDIERVRTLFNFLQGIMPDGIRISDGPKLTEEQAWTVIWYLGNEHWQVPDHIERCDVCGDLYDSHYEGDFLDYGESPYSFCDPCRSQEEYLEKLEMNEEE